ncbi:MAG TPA: arginine deiminase family protein [Actinomycetota bacterium]|nr:arginine deiminase family protein [Actinomycetota bacterium]
MKAIVRPPGDALVRAVSSHPERHLIDPSRARAQHAAYRATLESLGVELIDVPADDQHPDGCFTQDTAIVLGSAALIGCFALASRRGEEAAVRAVLAERGFAVRAVDGPATLEGGDVLEFGSRLLVGRSRRTNDAGVAALAAFAEPLGYTVETVEVPDWAVHLSTSATVVDGRIALGVEEVIAQPAFRGAERVPVGDDRLAANVVSIGRHVVAAGQHGVHRQLAALGIEVHAVDLSDFNRADGSPTCLSLLLP